MNEYLFISNEADFQELMNRLIEVSHKTDTKQILHTHVEVHIIPTKFSKPVL